MSEREQETVHEEEIFVKALFFDIDGTLLDDNPGGKILESTYRTLDKLKENGHFVAIATGRAQYMAMDAAKEAHIDCLVTDGGNGITLHNDLSAPGRRNPDASDDSEKAL